MMSGGRPHAGVVALVASGPNDAWLLPDGPFVNAGCQVQRASSLEEVEAFCERHMPALVVLPLALGSVPTMTGLRRCLAAKPAPAVLVIAANDQINAAAEAMREGAFDCLFKPFSVSRLSKTIEAALSALPDSMTRPASAGVAPIPTAFGGRTSFEPDQRGATTLEDGVGAAEMIGVSSAMRLLAEQIAALAPSPAPVFVTGEVGVGKSLVARMLHDRSDRRDGPFVTVDCAALCLERAEQDLFGPGGAASDARGGTLFLDEICELDPVLQPRLLRQIGALTDGTPGNGPELRIISTTRHAPHQAIRDGRLRADLFYRLHVGAIDLPPLRNRPDDITAIARSKLLEYGEAEGRNFTGFTDGALAQLAAYDWPGNVRELLNTIWSLVLMNPGPLVTPDLLPAHVAAPHDDRPAPSARVDGAAVAAAPAQIDHLLGKTLAESEREVIEATIRAEGGSVPRAARVLDVSPSTLYRKREAWLRDGED